MNGYSLPHKAGEIVPVSFLVPELGNCVILRKSNPEEYSQQWGRESPVKYLYRCMID